MLSLATARLRQSNANNDSEKFSRESRLRLSCVYITVEMARRARARAREVNHDSSFYPVAPNDYIAPPSSAYKVDCLDTIRADGYPVYTGTRARRHVLAISPPSIH